PHRQDRPCQCGKCTPATERLIAAGFSAACVFMPTPLSARLAQAVPVDFFRPLTRPSAPVYVDCADRLIDEAGEAGRLSHKETLEILREVLAAHPGSLLAE